MSSVGVQRGILRGFYLTVGNLGAKRPIPHRDQISKRPRSTPTGPRSDEIQKCRVSVSNSDQWIVKTLETITLKTPYLPNISIHILFTSQDAILDGSLSLKKRVRSFSFSNHLIFRTFSQG
jgi:hypothetical protein